MQKVFLDFLDATEGDVILEINIKHKNTATCNTRNQQSTVCRSAWILLYQNPQPANPAELEIFLEWSWPTKESKKISLESEGVQPQKSLEPALSSLIGSSCYLFFPSCHSECSPRPPNEARWSCSKKENPILKKINQNISDACCFIAEHKRLRPEYRRKEKHRGTKQKIRLESNCKNMHIY